MTTHARQQTALECLGIHNPDQQFADAAAELAKFVSILMRRHAAQVSYDIHTNIPVGIVESGKDLPGRNVRMAVVSAIGEYLGWDIDAAGKMCVDILSDVNAHDEAAALQGILQC